ncbi:MAG: L-threonylcarbamoyladenylate synthase [Nitrososphaerota archaeon]|nr:L-threonylcarbamoyladenylate synthase [Aigarchaeota archaeon]MDW8076134.1 L-threonylcarbamoyladenylate synthase [Nitrososphaerota archaeon]
MRLLKVSKEAIRLASLIIKDGGLVVYPTDTVYGLGCNPLDDAAVSKVFLLKGRKDVPVPILGDSIESLEKVAEFDDVAYEFCSAFWPGALSVVLPKKLPLEKVTCGSPTVAVRVPASQTVIELARLSGGLLVGTSANISGMPPACDVSELDRRIAEGVEVVLDGGRCPHCIASTVVKIEGRTIRVLREGAVSLNAIRDRIAAAKLNVKLE